VKKKELEADFELNIASIIDCFTVLITYLLLSASFITLGIFDVTVASTAPAETTAVPPASQELTLTIGVQSNNDLKLETEGKETNSFTIPGHEGAQNLEALEDYLKKIKQKYPSLESAMVTAEDTTLYKELVKTVEVTRKTLPQVALSADLTIQRGT
jgi:biopolymer transport protein ExbD